MFVAVMWNLWSTRNKIVFNKVVLKWEEVWSIRLCAKDWFQTYSNRSSRIRYERKILFLEIEVVTA